MLSFLGACSTNGESDDTKIGRLEAEIKSLNHEISELHLKNGINEVSDIGSFTVTVVIALFVFFLNNIIWLIFYKRKK